MFSYNVLLEPCSFFLLNDYFKICYYFGLFNHFAETLVSYLDYLLGSILTNICKIEYSLSNTNAQQTFQYLKSSICVWF